uniref:Complex III subunit 9 n=1 Tax=Zea mays TaxID=4577 RepID=B7ZXP8_MAIZE|nr:unknown [Zea mays]
MGFLDALYRVVMRRNAVYVTFVVAGAFAGERAVDYGVHKIWEMNNLGVTFLFPASLSLCCSTLINTLQLSTAN